jgi:hypothetical protein
MPQYLNQITGREQGLTCQPSPVVKLWGGAPAHATNQLRNCIWFPGFTHICPFFSFFFLFPLHGPWLPGLVSFYLSVSASSVVTDWASCDLAEVSRDPCNVLSPARYKEKTNQGLFSGNKNGKMFSEIVKVPVLFGIIAFQVLETFVYRSVNFLFRFFSETVLHITWIWTVKSERILY